MSFFTMIWRKIARKGPKWEERRKFIRLSAHHLLKYKVLDKDAEMSFIRNISAGGALFYCKQELPVGSMIEMEVNFPHYPHPIKVVSKIIRTKKLKKMGGFEIGAEFISVDGDARDFINKKISSVDEEVKNQAGGKKDKKKKS